MGLRRDIHQRYNIEGSGGRDLYVSLFHALPTSLTYLVLSSPLKQLVHVVLRSLRPHARVT